MSGESPDAMRSAPTDVPRTETGEAPKTAEQRLQQDYEAAIVLLGGTAAFTAGQAATKNKQQNGEGK